MPCASGPFRLSTARRTVPGMCRNIVPLNNLEPAATDDECPRRPSSSSGRSPERTRRRVPIGPCSTARSPRSRRRPVPCWMNWSRPPRRRIATTRRPSAAPARPTATRPSASSSRRRRPLPRGRDPRGPGWRTGYARIDIPRSTFPAVPVLRRRDRTRRSPSVREPPQGELYTCLRMLPESSSSTTTPTSPCS